jgi:hypothetical protein
LITSSQASQIDVRSLSAKLPGCYALGRALELKVVEVNEAIKNASRIFTRLSSESDDRISKKRSSANSEKVRSWKVLSKTSADGASSSEPV